MKTEARKSDVWNDADECVSGWTCTVTYTDEEMAELLANYDEASGTSPTVGYCRPTVREILDSVKLTGLN
jgi:hypothetical protein